MPRKRIFTLSVNDPGKPVGHTYEMRKWLNERLKELRTAGKSKSGLAARLGVAPSRITEIISGARGIDAAEVPPMADYLEWPEGVLLAHIRGEKPVMGPVSTVKVIGVVQAGLWQEAIEREQADWYSIPVPAQYGQEGPKRYGLEVRGPSMNELYPDGSIVICVKLVDAGVELKNGQRVVVQRTSPSGMEATIKELRIDDQGVWWLWPRSTDPNFQQPWRLPKADDPHNTDEEIAIIAVVVASYRPE